MQMVHWAGRTSIVPISDASDREPSDHDASLSFVDSSIEIGVRRTATLRFLSHLDIIRNALAEAQNAQSPLSIPIPEISHTFDSGKGVALKNVDLEPDALFGIQYPPLDDPDFRFFALEYDRSTEDVEPSGNLLRASWLRKVLSYSSIPAHPTPIYQSYLKVPTQGPGKLWWKGELVEMLYYNISAFTRTSLRNQIINTVEKISAEGVPGITFSPLESDS